MIDFISVLTHPILTPMRLIPMSTLLKVVYCETDVCSKSV